MESKASRLLLAILFGFLFAGPRLMSQVTDGRVFLPTPETVSIHEFNEFPGLNDGDGIPSGTTIPDLSGNGLNATVEANDAPTPELIVNLGDGNFDVPAGANRECERAQNLTGGARVAVNNDHDAYEMTPIDDFSIELYVNREDIPGTANWGILAGTWHSRNLIDDSVGNPDGNGAWYGYGLISVPIFAGHPTETWQWILSPVIDDVPFLGLSGQAEVKLPEFDIPPGRHYVVLSVDRALQTAVTFVDGIPVAQLNLDPTWAFTTPPGRDHARFMLFNAENDPTLGSYQPSPRGTHLDSVRVQRRALTAEEATENWSNIQSGIPSPPALVDIQAIVGTTATEALVGQCVLLNGRASAPGAGKTIVKWEWKVDAGAFEEGTAEREVWFPAASAPGGVPVTLRITNSAAESASATTAIRVQNHPAVARILVRNGTVDLPGKNLIVPVGTVLSMDGTSSASAVPDGVFSCPISGGDELTPSAITEFHWDTDGDSDADEFRPFFDLPAQNSVRDFTITLMVRNEAGGEGSASIQVKVIASQGNSAVFHDTPDTIFHVEFNEAPEGAVADGTVFPDLSSSGLQLTMVDPAGGNLQVEGGPVQFDDNRAVTMSGGGNGPRGEVRDDGGLFEMGVDDSFTFEIYVKPGESDLPQWGDMAGTFKARTDGTEASARYGWGFIKSAIDVPANHTQGYAWILCSGNGGAAEHQLNFQVEKGAYNYVACTVDRAALRAEAFVNGVRIGQMAVDPGWSFETPLGFPAAPFYLFTREQITGQFSNCPSPMSVDALRLQMVALTAEQVAANWDDIQSGRGADSSAPPLPPGLPTGLVAVPSAKKVSLSWSAPSSGPSPTGYTIFRDGARLADVLAAPTAYQDTGLLDDTRYCYRVRSTGPGGESDLSLEACVTTPPTVTQRDFRRGDVDGNQIVELTDVVNLLGYLYRGDPPNLSCFDAADIDDTGVLELTDAIVGLGWLYQGSPASLPDPGPFACGPDKDPTDTFPDCVYTCP